MRLISHYKISDDSLFVNTFVCQIRRITIVFRKYRLKTLPFFYGEKFSREIRLISTVRLNGDSVPFMFKGTLDGDLFVGYIDD